MNFIKKTIITAILMLVSHSTAFSLSLYTLEIISSSSEIEYSPFLTIGSPPPEIFQISGRFSLTIDESSSDNNLWFETINISTNIPEDRPFSFPTHQLDYDGLNFQGSADPCFDYSGSGLCFSHGSFDYARGHFNGASLELTGSNPINLYDSYTYKIDASVIESSPIPEPSTILLLGTGLGGLVFYRRKTNSL